MTKKEYLITVLDAIPDRQMGRGLKTLIANNQLNEETIDKMVVIFKRAMDRIVFHIKDKKILEKIQASEHLIEQQTAQSAQDSTDLKNLDAMLNAF